MTCHIGHHRTAASVAEISHEFHRDVAPTPRCVGTAPPHDSSEAYRTTTRQGHLGVFRAKPPLPPKAATLPACTCSKCTCSRALCSTRAGPSPCSGVFPSPVHDVGCEKPAELLRKSPFAAGISQRICAGEQTKLTYNRPADLSLPNADACGSNRPARVCCPADSIRSYAPRG